jgi:hypothetical protein
MEPTATHPWFSRVRVACWLLRSKGPLAVEFWRLFNMAYILTAVCLDDGWRSKPSTVTQSHQQRRRNIHEVKLPPPTALTRIFFTNRHFPVLLASFSAFNTAAVQRLHQEKMLALQQTRKYTEKTEKEREWNIYTCSGIEN